MTKLKCIRDHFAAVLLMAVVDFLAVLILLIVLLAGQIQVAASQKNEVLLEDEAMDLQISLSMNTLRTDFEQMLEEKTIAEQRERQLYAADIERPSVGDYMGRIIIESAGIDLPLYFGDTASILNQGVGTYTGSALPGFPGLTLVCSHNGARQFGPLGQVVPGDMVAVEMPYSDYVYQVDEVKIVDAKDSSAYDFTITKDQLIIYTCYPLYYSAPTNDRLFLYCTRVSGKEVIVQ